MNIGIAIIFAAVWAGYMSVTMAEPVAALDPSPQDDETVAVVTKVLMESEQIEEPVVSIEAGAPATKGPPPLGLKASVFKNYFGDSLLDARGVKVPYSKLEGKYVGVYFSASWCPGCRQFSPVLKQFRDKFAQDFEVVLVGADQSDDAHNKYIASENMNWLQVQWGSRQAQSLIQAFQISKYPTLIFISDEGKAITAQGCEMVFAHLDLLAVESDRLHFETKSYNCGKCDKEHLRLSLRAGED